MLARTHRAGLRAPLAVAGLLLALVVAMVTPVEPAAASGELERLGPSFVCPEEGQTVNRWAVFNPNAIEVPFSWELHKSAQSGAAVAAPGVNTVVTTTPIPGPNILRVFVDGQLLRAVPATPACLAFDTEDTGTLRVLSVLAHDDGPEFDESFGPGVVVRVDDAEVGVSDAEGIVEVTLEPGTYDVEAVIPSLARARDTVEILAGETTAVTMRLESGKVIIEDADLEVDELVNGALPFSTESVTLRFTRDGAHIPVSRLVEVELRSAAIESSPIDLSPYFGVTEAGTIAATHLATVLFLLSVINSEATLLVWAVDEERFTYRERVSFVPGSFGVEVVLEAPPSRPDLPLGGIAVQLRSGAVHEELTTGASGSAIWSHVPAGPLHIEASTESGGHVYTGLADVSVSRDHRVRLRLLGVDDVLAGVRPWIIEPAFFGAGVASTTPAEHAEAREAAAAAGEQALPAPMVATTSDTVSIFTIAGSQNVPMTDSASLEVPEGTPTVTLTYDVGTAEYPFWVMQQSIFDDTWRLTVTGGNGATLHTAGRNVNSQLYGAPVWNGAGRTGEIQLELDVSALTGDGPTNVVVSAHATNIGDSILPTSVTATLSTEKTLTIDELENDQVPRAGRCRATVRHDHYSIPRPATNPGLPASSTNVVPRWFDLTYTAPDDVTVTNVEVELLDAGGAVLDTVVDAAPGTASVQQTGDAQLRVRVTYHDEQSPIASTPPPTDRMRYKFTLTGSDGSGATLESEPKESAPYFPLWRMPDGLARFSPTAGPRDEGLDDWSARTTYTWLDANRNLVTSINDISGEHSRNICHRTHAEGKDIDMFHVYTFPGGGGSGGANYLRLFEAAQGALAGDAAHLQRLDDWASQTRARFDLLLADPQVRQLRYALGGATEPGTAADRELTEGWAEALMRHGTYTNPAGHQIVLPAGAWGNAGHANMFFDDGHHTHFHVALH